jgi:hypothetical protein
MPEPKVQNQTRPLLYIVALLGEHCDFDELRAKNEGECPSGLPSSEEQALMDVSVAQPSVSSSTPSRRCVAAKVKLSAHPLIGLISASRSPA